MSFVSELYDVRMREIAKVKAQFYSDLSSRMMLDILDGIDGAKQDLLHQAACLTNHLCVSLKTNIEDLSVTYSHLFEALDTPAVCMVQRADPVVSMLRRVEKEFDGMHIELVVTATQIVFTVGVTLSENFLRKIHIDG
jgi:hypothetical protein